MRIAIADDDPIVCQSLSTILTATGSADVLWTANDGDAALTSYFREPAARPDILLIDIQMPGRDGISAAREILRRDPAARILFLTTFADRSYIAQAVELGAKGYLIKQDVAAVAPALQAVMAGQVVLGSDVIGKLTGGGEGAAGGAGALTGGAAAGGAAQSGLPTSGGVTDTVTGGAGMPERGTDEFADLTDRDREIVALVAEGLDNRQIAARVFLSEGTVRNRISAVLERTGLSNRTQLAVRWLKRAQ